MIDCRRRNYLVTFHPLCSTARGRQAIRVAKLPAFIDGSCRREPDLESEHPSITSLCRAGKFAPRLRKNDRVLYMTVKGHYRGVEGRALVAALEVTHVFPSHQRAARWYRGQGLTLPSNCMVPANGPIAAHLTTGLPRNPEALWRVWSASVQGPATLAAWDQAYAQRSKRHPRFVVTKPLRPVAITAPKILSDQQICAALGTWKVPGTQNYKLLSDAAFESLLRRLKNGNR